MYTSHNRILTSHIGSLPRPADVLARIYQHQEGIPFDKSYWNLVKEGVDEMVGLQKSAGIDIVSDGEVGKVGFNNYISERVTGLGGETVMWSFKDLEIVPEVQDRQYQSEGGKHINMPACIGEINYMGQNFITRDLANFRQALDTHQVEKSFVPSITPGSVAFCVVDRHYGNYEDYIMALAVALKEEYEAIVEAGFMLQLDATDLPICHPNHGNFWASKVVEEMGYTKFIELNLEAINVAVENIPGEKLRLHLCWANYEGPHHFDAPLSEVLNPVLKNTTAKTIAFEAANPRHEHEWTYFRNSKIADDIIIMPGVIDTTTNFVEHPELVAQRIERYAAIVGRERVIAGTDCGFGTFAGFGEVAPAAVWLKLASLSEGAAIASSRLYG